MKLSIGFKVKSIEVFRLAAGHSTPAASSPWVQAVFDMATVHLDCLQDNPAMLNRYTKR
jgi:hypothetical protein